MEDSKDDILLASINRLSAQLLTQENCQCCMELFGVNAFSDFGDKLDHVKRHSSLNPETEFAGLTESELQMDSKFVRIFSKCFPNTLMFKPVTATLCGPAVSNIFPKIEIPECSMEEEDPMSNPSSRFRDGNDESKEVVERPNTERRKSAKKQTTLRKLSVLKWKCRFCTKRFASKFHFKAHERIHTGEKPYLCGTCGKRFAQQTGLDQHKRIHTGEKPYRCRYCQTRFRQRSQQMQHERIHTGESPYSCSLCAAVFKQMSNLNDHKKTHRRLSPESREASIESVVAKVIRKNAKQVLLLSVPCTRT